MSDFIFGPPPSPPPPPHLSVNTDSININTKLNNKLNAKLNDKLNAKINANNNANYKRKFNGNSSTSYKKFNGLGNNIENNNLNQDLDEEEDENVFINSNGEKKPKIPGTNILLDSPVAIAKWIEERKKNYPTAARILEKGKKNNNNKNSNEKRNGNKNNSKKKFKKNNQKNETENSEINNLGPVYRAYAPPRKINLETRLLLAQHSKENEQILDVLMFLHNCGLLGE